MLLSLAALMVMSPPVAAQPQMDPLTVDGVVVSSGNSSLVIDTDAGARKGFLVDTSTVLPAAGLIAGNRVSVLYHPLDAERAQAVSVVLLEPGVLAGGVTSPSDATVPPPTGDQGAGLEQSPGPVDMGGPVPLLGMASLAVVAIGLFAWVFARRSDPETPHLSL
ncbi:MAG TPA: hypothetical protein VI669_09025 [Vicinamibacteria bacterium]